MKPMVVTRKIILYNILFRFIISTVILCLKNYAKIVFYNFGTAEEFLNNVNMFLITTNIPVMLIIGILFYFYLKPLEIVISKLYKGEAVDPSLMNNAKNVIRKFSLYMILLTLIANVGSQFVTIIFDGSIRNFFDVKEFTWTLFMIASALLYSFGHVTISNQVFAEPRKLLNIYYMEKNRNQIGLRIKNILLFSLLIMYSFTFFLHYAAYFYSKESYYSAQLKAVNENKISLAEAENNYKSYMYTIMDHGKIKEKVASRIKFPYSQSGNRIMDYIFFFVISFLTLFCIGFVIVYLFSRELIIQIRNQRATIKDILAGKENLSKRISIIQYDEVGDLTDMINTLMDRLKDILNQIKDSSMTVSNSSDSLNEKLLNTTTAIEEMVSSLVLITKNITNQTAVVENTKKQLEVMLNGIEKISANIENQVSFVEQTSAAMQEMAKNIISVNENTSTASDLSNNLIKISKEGDVAVKNTIDAIKKIENASNQVLNIVEILTNLSAQTSLLAVNTAIEAAHAGQHGRGFAIIAGEIRKLSENSVLQTKEITHYIMDMYERVKNGSQMSEQAGLAFQDISRDIEKTTSLIDQINFAMNEQKMGTNEILSSVDSVVNASLEVKNIATDLKRQSQVISGYMKELFNISYHIDSATKEQDKGNKEILSLVNNVKEISTQNINVVKKLKSIVTGFNIDS